MPTFINFSLENIIIIYSLLAKPNQVETDFAHKLKKTIWIFQDFKKRNAKAFRLTFEGKVLRIYKYIFRKKTNLLNKALKIAFNAQKY
jgi:hypothetical protein